MTQPWTYFQAAEFFVAIFAAWCLVSAVLALGASRLPWGKP